MILCPLVLSGRTVFSNFLWGGGGVGGGGGEVEGQTVFHKLSCKCRVKKRREKKKKKKKEVWNKCFEIFASGKYLCVTGPFLTLIPNSSQQS